MFFESFSNEDEPKLQQDGAYSLGAFPDCPNDATIVNTR